MFVDHCHLVFLCGPSSLSASSTFSEVVGKPIDWLQLIAGKAEPSESLERKADPRKAVVRE